MNDLKHGNSQQPVTVFAHTPPRLPVLLMDIFLNVKEHNDAVGHIEEEFEARLAKHGLRAAQAWVWIQALRSVGPFLLRVLSPLLIWKWLPG